jgi:methionyl-tRNA synthetase
MTSLKEAMQAAEAAAKATEEAQALQLQAEQKVAEVRSAESREKIMKLLQQVREYAVEMKNFDSDLQKEVKKELRTIVKCAYGEGRKNIW